MLEFYSKMLLEITWKQLCLLGLAVLIFRQIPAIAESRANYSPLLRQNYPEYSPQGPTAQEKHYVLRAFRHCFSSSVLGGYPWPRVVSLQVL